MVSSFQYITVSVAFSISKPFRAPIYSNLSFLLSLIGLYGFTIYFALYPAHYVAVRSLEGEQSKIIRDSPPTPLFRSAEGAAVEDASAVVVPRRDWGRCGGQLPLLMDLGVHLQHGRNQAVSAQVGVGSCGGRAGGGYDSFTTLALRGICRLMPKRAYKNDYKRVAKEIRDTNWPTELITHSADMRAAAAAAAAVNG